MTFLEMYRFIWQKISFLLFNKSVLVAEIEKMSAEEFKRRATSSKNIKINSGELEIYTIFSYKDPLVQTLIWNIKYRKNKIFLKIAGGIVQEELMKMIFTNPIIIPTPISNKRRRERGYNQTEEILRSSYNDGHCNEEYEIRYDLLKKVVHTKNQTKLKRKDRKKNLEGAFVVTNKQAIAGRNIIIFDDVITTGTTITEIAQTLKKAGARKVVALAIA
ncbi:MAG: phosphoribosyltransferase family protein, partial [Candidatus Paceibacterota bacterium]